MLLWRQLGDPPSRTKNSCGFEQVIPGGKSRGTPIYKMRNKAIRPVPSIKNKKEGYRIFCLNQDCEKRTSSDVPRGTPSPAKGARTTE